MTKFTTLFVRIAPAAFLVVAALLIGRELETIGRKHLWTSFAAISPSQWLAAAALTATGYGVLTFYDRLALHFFRAAVPWRKTAEGAFLSFAVSHNVGVGWLSGGAMRQRVYGPLGIDLATVARVTVMNSITFFIGAAALLGTCLILEPTLAQSLIVLPPTLVPWVGGGLLALVAAYLLACATGPRTVGGDRFNLPLPGVRLAIAQLLLSSADIMLAAGALYVLLPASATVGFATLLGIYLIAIGGSLLTYVPGGLGVMEALIIWSMPSVPLAQLAAALIAYRLVYYLLPLALALLLVGGKSMKSAACTLARRSPAVGQTTPLIAAAVSMAAGCYLLLAGALPATSLEALRMAVPLPLLELSHLAGSLAGLVLVLLATALYRRFDSARTIAVALLIAGSVSRLVQGHQLIEAALLGGAALVLKLSAPAFYRRGSLMRNALTPGGLAAGFAALGLSILVGFNTYANVAYSNDLWWQFTYDGNAPRFLRASLLAAAVALVLTVRRWLGPSRVVRSADLPDAAARAIIAASPEASANLALLGDKKLLRSASGRAFLMYQVEGRSWIAMGDPVGPREEWPDLVWALRELADRAGGRPFFYETLGDHLALYADAGLVAHKLGEEARVSLADFDLAAPERKGLRAAQRRGLKEGLSVEIFRAGSLGGTMDELQQVSRAWLKAKGANEKSFSLGFAAPAYLQQCDCAIVLRDGQILAFANLWRSGEHAELSPDLMRYLPEAPRVTMTFLLTELMLRAQAEGFGWFNLGMAPLAGMSRHRLAPLSQAVARLVFEHGERLYGFAGLRRFKEQFRPEWRSRYAVCAPGLVPLAAGLIDCTRLISRPSAPLAPPNATTLAITPGQPVRPVQRPTTGPMLPTS